MRIQKRRQAPGQHVFGGRSVLQGHGVLLFRNRPLELRCGAVLKAWELHFGANFLSVQKATLSTSSSSTTSSSRSSSSRPSSCNRCIQKDPEGTSSLGAACFWRLFRPSVAWCFGVARGMLWKPATAAEAAAAVAAAAAAGPAAKLAFVRIQKGRQASGQHVFGGRSVLQGHGVLLFRNRPLEFRCGAVLRAWELHFGASFLSVQKATLGSRACFLGAASVL